MPNEIILSYYLGNVFATANPFVPSLTLSPMLSFQGVFLFSMVQYKPLDYIGYVYPWWGQTIGWLLGLSSMLCIPSYALYKYLTATGTFSEVNTLPLLGHSFQGEMSIGDTGGTIFETY